MAATTDWSIPGYEIEEWIGGGGMGEVFLAVRQSDAVPVVVKVASQAADQKTLKRLNKEHRLLAAVDHPHVVKLLDCGYTGDRPYLVLEYVDGRSLRDLMRPGQPLAAKQVTSVLGQLSAALSGLHAQNILHRDVKPENVLLDSEGQVKLVDLSIGTELAELGELTSQGEFLGTVDYMAPEQRHRLHVDYRTDQYSLAAMAFEMVTGHCPLGQFRKPSDLNPRLEETVDDVLLKALEADADDRFESVDEFTRALIVALQTPYKRQASGILISAAAVAVIATVFALVLTARSVEERDEPGKLLRAGTPSHPVASLSAQQSPVTAKQREWAKRLEQPVETTNKIGMQLVLIPPGQFQMGMSQEALDSKPRQVNGRRYADTKPLRQIEIERPFLICAYEVTIAQFRQFVDATHYETEPERGMDPRFGANEPNATEPANWRSPGYPVTENHPVSCLTWNDAVAFCEWLSNLEDETYRLPTDVEWEYACRAGSETAWSFGNDLSQRHRYCSLAEPRKPTVPSAVGGDRLPNSFGLFDMHGNVSEWCHDVFEHGGAVATDEDPASADAPRVVRGGSCNAHPWILRSAVRVRTGPRFSGFVLGFRVVREVPTNDNYRIAREPN